jgi:hypothetical protein
LDLNVWRSLNRIIRAPDPELIDMARRTVKMRAADYSSLASQIVVPLINLEGDRQWLDDFATEWLNSPHNSNAWVELFVSGKYDPNHAHAAQTGVEWLARLGRGSNQWMVLWLYHRERLPFDLWAQLAEDWLNEARIDLSSWPKVFEIVQSLGPLSLRMVECAQLWMKVRGAKKRNAVIEKAALSKSDKP